MHMKTQRLKGFAVIERPDGALIWGTVRQDRAAAWSVYLNHNPQIEGFPTDARTVAVEVFIHEALDGGSECNDQSHQAQSIE